MERPLTLGELAAFSTPASTRSDEIKWVPIETSSPQEAADGNGQWPVRLDIDLNDALPSTPLATWLEELAGDVGYNEVQSILVPGHTTLLLPTFRKAVKNAYQDLKGWTRNPLPPLDQLMQAGHPWATQFSRLVAVTYRLQLSAAGGQYELEAREPRLRLDREQLLRWFKRST